MSRDINNNRRRRRRNLTRCYSAMRNTRSVSSKKRRRRTQAQLTSCELLFCVDYTRREVCKPHRGIVKGPLILSRRK
jgi:hypothetical protein